MNGNMLAGVGLLAYPAEYGVSGIASFIVNHDGVVYQNDLGPETAMVAVAMTVSIRTTRGSLWRSKYR